jgi:hypothetical protein
MLRRQADEMKAAAEAAEQRISELEGELGDRDD